jgi:DNA-binding response OmpR family regulator
VDWKNDGVQSLLVKPIGTQDLLRQIEALLIRQQDENRSLDGAEPLAEVSAERKDRKAS